MSLYLFRNRPATIIFFLVFAGLVRAEVLYLKDGQVLNGSIVKENDKFIWFKTKYKSSKFDRNKVVRVLYGQRELEKIYIQMKDERIIEAFMVDQDNKKVTIRLNKDSAKEDHILKSNIQQMSNERILVLRPAISLRTGYFIPLSTKSGADLQPTIMFMVGYGMRLLFIDNSRVMFEAGFAKNTSTFTDVDGKSRELSLQTIPLIVNYMYKYNFSRFFGSSKAAKPKAGSASQLDSTRAIWHRFDLLGKIGMGASFLTFDDAEGEKLSGIKMTALGGLGVSYELLRRRLFTQILSEFFFVYDQGATLQALLLSFRLEYRF